MGESAGVPALPNGTGAPPGPSTRILRMMISFLAAFRTFRPSRFRNFLQVYSFPVVFSLARKISQNSSLEGCPQLSPLLGTAKLGTLGWPLGPPASPPSQWQEEMPQGWKEPEAKNLSREEGEKKRAVRRNRYGISKLIRRGKIC